MIPTTIRPLAPAPSFAPEGRSARPRPTRSGGLMAWAIWAIIALIPGMASAVEFSRGLNGSVFWPHSGPTLQSMDPNSVATTTYHLYQNGGHLQLDYIWFDGGGTTCFQGSFIVAFDACAYTLTTATKAGLSAKLDGGWYYLGDNLPSSFAETEIREYLDDFIAYLAKNHTTYSDDVFISFLADSKGEPPASGSGSVSDTAFGFINGNPVWPGDGSQPFTFPGPTQNMLQNLAFAGAPNSYSYLYIYNDGDVCYRGSVGIVGTATGASIADQGGWVGSDGSSGVGLLPQVSSQVQRDLADWNAACQATDDAATTNTFLAGLCHYHPPSGGGGGGGVVSNALSCPPLPVHICTICPCDGSATGAPSPSVAAGGEGGSSPGQSGPQSQHSFIDNQRMLHIHRAIDYQIQPATGGCAACGSSRPSSGTLPALELTRIHRYLDSDLHGSFGPGVFSSYDVYLNLSASAGTIEFWDPRNTDGVDLTDPTHTGLYIDAAEQTIAGLQLYDANGAATAAQPMARRGILTTHDGRAYTFEIIALDGGASGDAMGRLIASADRTGNATTISYVDPATAALADLAHDPLRWWRMSSITDAYGQSATCAYQRINGQWVIQSIALPNGTALSYRYDTDALIGVNQIAFPDGTVSTFRTSPGGDGFTQQVVLDDAAATGTDRRGTIGLSLDQIRTPSSAQRQPMNRIRWECNGAGELAYRNWMTTSQPYAYTYIYDAGGAGGTGTMMLYVATDAGPFATYRATSFDRTQYADTYAWVQVGAYTTDSLKRVDSIVDAAGRSIAVTRNAAGSITQSTESQVNGAAFASASSTYNGFEQPLQQVDSLGRITQYTYDAAGNMLSKTAAAGQPEQSAWHWTYNGRGQPLSATDANGNQTDYVYDENPGDAAYKRLIAVIEPPDSPGAQRYAMTYAYDAAGRLATSVDESGRTVAYSYDGRNRLAQVLYADGSTEISTYGTSTAGTANLLIEKTDRNGNITAHAYDAACRRVATTIAPASGTPVVGSSQWSYLPGSISQASETINGSTTSFGYDYANRRVSETRTPRPGTVLTTSTFYDDTQRPAYRQDAYGRRTYVVLDYNNKPTRTVQELIPGALSALVPLDSAQDMDAALMALARIPGANPAYVISDDSYDTEGQQTGHLDGRGYLSTVAYDHQGRRISETSALGLATATGMQYTTYAGRTQYTYDAQGNQTAIIRPRSSIPQGDGTFATAATTYGTTYGYTGRNLKCQQSEGSGADAAVTTFTYTPTKKIASQTDPRNAAWVTTYTYYACCDRLYQAIDPLGFATTYVYDANGNVTSTRDANSVGSDKAYDARNRVLTSTTTAGDTTATAYDDDLTDGLGLDAAYGAALAGLSFGPGCVGSAVATTNPAGETSLQIADGLGRVIRQVDGNGHAVTTGYDAVLGNGLVATTTTDALGDSMEQHADGSGRIRERLDAAQQLSAAGFDAAGNQLFARDPNGVGWSVADDTTATPGMDGRGRVLARADTHQDGASFTYDLDGDILTQTDALGHATTMTYDTRDRKATVLDRVGGTTHFAYDARSNLVSIQDADPLAGTTVYTYDARNQLATETFPPNAGQASTVRTYAYDPGGRLQSRAVATVPASALNETTTYGYDLENRLISRAYSDGLGNDAFAYDPASRLVTATSGRYAISVQRSYTGNTPPEQGGRLTSETVTITGANPGVYTTSYQYDAANRTTQISYPSGDIQARSYTSRNQLSGVAFDGSAVANRTYDNGGRLGTTTLGNGLVETRGYRSDAAGVDDYLVSLAIPGISQFAYQADANKRTTSESDGRIPAFSQNFSGYDNENRLTAWSRDDGSSQTWTLSPVGDWQQTTINGTAQTRTHDAVHEATTISGALAQPTYDGKGNLTTNLNGAQYTWDMENRLATATIADAASGAQGTASYRYDALGRRIQKSVYGTTTTFIHDGAQVIDEFDAPVSRPASSATQHGSGAGQPAGGDPLADQGPQVLRIDAQPWSSPIPSGFMGDFGQVYGALDNGQTYGWSSDQSANAVTRGIEIALPQFDSFIQFGTQSPAPAASWSIGNMQPGTYAVIAVFGDAASTNQTNDVSIQGISEIDQTPAQPDNAGYPLGNFDGYAETVTVSESGTITISALSTAFNPKLCFVEIGPVGSSITAADRANLANLVAQANAATQQTQAIQKKQPSPRLYAYGSYVDEPLMMQAAGHKYYYASNHLYSVSALTDSTGAVVERYKYDAYGRQGILNINGMVSYCPSDYGNFIGFTGRYHDWETGLVYFRARYMDTGLGRFIGRDSAGYVDGMTLYAAYYVPNMTDPTGMEFIVNSQGISLDDLNKDFPQLLPGMQDTPSYLGRTAFPTPVVSGEDNIEEYQKESPKCKWCARVVSAKKIDVTVNSYWPTTTEYKGKTYLTANGMASVHAHENRRVEAYRRAYNGYLDKAQLGNDWTVNCGEVCKDGEGEAKAALQNYLEQLRNSAIRNFKNYAESENFNIGLESSGDVKINGVYDHTDPSKIPTPNPPPPFTPPDCPK